MRFLFATHPSVGHLQPVVPIARELLGRGHDVRVVAARSFQPVVRELGLEPLEAGLDWSRADPERAFPAVAGVPPAERYRWLLTNVYADAAARRTTDDLRAAFREWLPDVVVHQQMELGSLLAAQLAGIPHASFGFGQGVVASDRRIGGPALAPLRVGLGLEADPELVAGFDFLRFEFAPAAYLAPDAVRRETTHHIRPDPIEYAPAGTLAEVAPELEAPAVVVTLGMNYNRTPGVFEAAIEALAEEPVNVVVTVGPNRDPVELEPLPGNVRAVRYVPLAQLLPDADVVVCHGGFNTIMAAVSAGTPVVLLPIDSDQPVQAQRCVELGLGLSVTPGELSPQSIRRAVAAVRSDPRYRVATAEFREELESLPSFADAADLLERLATDGCPIPARGSKRQGSSPIASSS